MGSIFRGVGDTKMDNDHLGVGSTLFYERAYLIFAINDCSINIIDLTDFKICGNDTHVEDIHFISHKEIRDCCSPLQLSDSDFDYNAKGLKWNKIK